MEKILFLIVLNGTLTLSNSLLTIGENAFNGCSGFHGDLTIPGSVEIIESNAFFKCTGFDGKLTIGNGLKNIKSFTFSFCQFKGKLENPQNIEMIDNNAFENCHGFDQILISAKIQVIGEKSFYNCSKINGSLIFLQDVANINKEAFALTSFNIINYNGENEPNCSSDSFENDQIISVTENYTSPKFCGFLIPTKMFSYSSIFSESIFFSPSNEFTNSQLNTKSFTSSQKFAPSYSLIFNKSIVFSSSNELTISKLNTKSFTPSKQFTPSFTFHPLRTKYPDGHDDKNVHASIYGKNFFNQPPDAQFIGATVGISFVFIIVSVILMILYLRQRTKMLKNKISELSDSFLIDSSQSESSYSYSYYVYEC